MSKKTNKYININLKNTVIIVPLLLTIWLSTRDKLISEICSESLVQSVFIAVIDVFQHKRHYQMGRRRNGMILEQKAKIFCILIYSDMMEFGLFFTRFSANQITMKEKCRGYTSQDSIRWQTETMNETVTRSPTRQHKQTFPT